MSWDGAVAQHALHLLYFLFIVFVYFRLLIFFHLCCATTYVGEIKLYILHLRFL